MLNLNNTDNGGGSFSFTAAIDPNYIGDGAYDVSFVFTSSDGTSLTTTQHMYFDTHAPNVYVETYTGGSTMQFWISDNGSGIASISNLENNDVYSAVPGVDGLYEMTNLPDGNYYWTVCAVDNAGNTTLYPVEFTIHTFQPEFYNLFPANGATINYHDMYFTANYLAADGYEINPDSLSFTCTDVNGQTYTFTQTAGETSFLESSEGLPDGTYTVTASVADNAGLTGNAPPWTIRIYSPLPQFAYDNPPDANTPLQGTTAALSIYSLPDANGQPGTPIGTIYGYGPNATPLVFTRTSTGIEVQGLTNGQYNYSVYAINDAGTFNSFNWTFTVNLAMSVRVTEMNAPSHALAVPNQQNQTNIFVAENGYFIIDSDNLSPDPKYLWEVDNLEGGGSIQGRFFEAAAPNTYKSGLVQLNSNALDTVTVKVGYDADGSGDLNTNEVLQTLIIVPIKIQTLSPALNAVAAQAPILHPVNCILASLPHPVITVEQLASTDFSFDSNARTISFTITGSISDAFCDIVAPGQIDNFALQATHDGSTVSTVGAIRDTLEPASLLRPYAYKGNFELPVTIPVEDGDHEIDVQSTANLAGLQATGTITFKVDMAEFPSLGTVVTILNIASSASQYAGFYQPFLISVEAKDMQQLTQSGQLWGQSYSIAQSNDVYYFMDASNNPVVGAYLPAAINTNIANLNYNQLVNPSIMGATTIMYPVSPSRYIVPGAAHNAVRMHVPDALSTMNVVVTDNQSRTVRQFALSGTDTCWDGTKTNGKPLTELASPYKFTITGQQIVNGVSAPQFLTLSALRVEEYHDWALRIPGEASNRNSVALGVDATTVNSNTVDLMVQLDGGAVQNITNFWVNANTGDDGLDADMILQNTSTGPIVIYTTPSYPIDVKYKMYIYQKNSRIMDKVTNKWNFGGTTTYMDRCLQEFGVQPTADLNVIRNLQNTYSASGLPITTDDGN